MVYMDPDEVPWSAYLALAGAAVVIVAALLPWYESFGNVVTGLDHSDGYVTAGVAVATVAFLLGFEWNLIARIAAAIAGALSTVAGYNVYRQVTELANREPMYGLYLTVLGGGLLVIAAVWGSVEAREIVGEGEPTGGTDARESPAAPEDR